MPEGTTGRFTDPDDYQTSLPNLTMSLVITQPGKFDAQLTSVKLPNLRLLRARETLARESRTSRCPRNGFLSPLPPDRVRRCSGMGSNCGGAKCCSTAPVSVCTNGPRTRATGGSWQSNGRSSAATAAPLPGIVWNRQWWPRSSSRVQRIWEDCFACTPASLMSSRQTRSRSLIQTSAKAWNTICCTRWLPA